MADTKISALPAAVALTGTEILPVVQSAATAGATIAQVATYIAGSLSSSVLVNAQTGTTYTYVTGDKSKLVSHTNAATIAATLPAPGVSFPSGWFMYVENRGAGTLTITPTASTVDGAATLALTTNQGCLIASDGASYFTMRGVAAAGGAGTVTHTVGALTANALVVGNGAADTDVLASLGTTTTVLHGNAAGRPTYGAVALAADVSGLLPVANGGTGTGTPALVSGTNVTITGTWPNQTVNAAAGGFTGGTLTSALNEAPTVTIASAASVAIGAAAANAVTISGITTITSFDTIADGAVRLVTFSGALTLTHSGTALILPGAASITTAAGDSAIFKSLGAGNWRCLVYQKASGAAVVGGGGLVSITETLVTAAPNAGINTEQLAVTGGSTSVDFTLQPKGNGAFTLGPAADLTSTGGNKRGTQSVDLQLNRALAAQVASGANCVIAGGVNNTNAGTTSSIGGGSGNTVTAGSFGAIGGGVNNTITAGNSNVIAGGTGNTITSGAANSILGGSANSVSGGQSTAGGGSNTTSAINSVAFGISNNVSGAAGVALGNSCVVDAANAQARGANAHTQGITGSDAFASALRVTAGDLQRMQFVLGASTTDAVTATVLTTNRAGASATNCAILTSNCVLKIRGQISCLQRGTTTCTTWDISAAFSNNGSTTVAVGTPTITQAQNTGTAPTAPTLVISTNNIQVTVTGLAATTLVWGAELTCLMVA